mgnify:CR=1 FL=1
MDFLLGPLGLTIESQAEGYRDKLKDDRSKFKTWNAGDMLRDVLTPGTREELEAAAAQLQYNAVNKSPKRSIERQTIREGLNQTGVNLDNLDLIKGKDGIGGETQTEYETRLKGLLARATANLDNTAIPGYNQGLVTDGMGVSGIKQMGTNLKEQNITDKETKAEEKAERKLSRQEAIENRRLDITESQALRQNAYQNRVLDLKDSRESRNARDKQLLMIIQGLNAFGQGFQ